MSLWIEEQSIIISPRILRTPPPVRWPGASLYYEQSPDAIHIPAQMLSERPPRPVAPHSIPIALSAPRRVGIGSAMIRDHYFACPHCGRRVARLYLPDEQQVRIFACADCSGLRRRAPAQHGAWWRIERIANRLMINPDDPSVLTEIDRLRSPMQRMRLLTVLLRRSMQSAGELPLHGQRREPPQLPPPAPKRASKPKRKR